MVDGRIWQELLIYLFIYNLLIYKFIFNFLFNIFFLTATETGFKNNITEERESYMYAEDCMLSTLDRDL